MTCCYYMNFKTDKMLKCYAELYNIKINIVP